MLTKSATKIVEKFFEKLMQITFTTHLTHLIVNEIESENYNFKFILEKWEIIGVNEFIKRDKVSPSNGKNKLFFWNKIRQLMRKLKLSFLHNFFDEAAISDDEK